MNEARLARRNLPPGMTPRLLTAEQAAAYCNVGRESFETRVGVSPLKVFGNRHLYDRVALDLWLDQQSGLPAHDGTTGINWSERL
jgi:hypothetical protein